MQKPKPFVAQKLKEDMQLLSLQEQPELVILKSQGTTKEASPRGTTEEAQPTSSNHRGAIAAPPNEAPPRDTAKALPRSSPLSKRKGTIASLCTPPKPPPQPVEMRKPKKVRAIRTRSLVQTDV